MRIAIYGKRFDPEFGSFVETLIRLFAEREVSLIIEQKFSAFLRNTLSIPEMPVFKDSGDLTDVDFVVSIGGDGTLLETLTLVRESEIPVLGINTGRLGFLSLVDVDTIEQAVDSLINGKFAIDRRTVLQVSSSLSTFGNFPFALNELTLLNKERNSMIAVHTMVNGIFMNTYWADGLIVATPTGSTAYSLSCGGPIVMPDSGNFIVTPIAPHNLNARPFILSDQNTISLKPDGRDEQFLVNLDSRSFAIEKQEVLNINLAPFHFHLVNLFDQNFFTTIRNKLGWGLDKRN